MRSAIFDRFYSQALMAIEGQPAERIGGDAHARLDLVRGRSRHDRMAGHGARAVTKEPQRRPRSAAGRIGRSHVAHGM
jgi:hypothetical protein